MQSCTLAVLVVGVVLCAGFAAHAEQPVPVGVTAARSAAMIEEVSLHGDLVARRVARVAPEVDGQVEAITVDDGDAVAAGAIILRLDQRLQAIERDAAAAAVAEASATLEEAQRRHAELDQLSRTQHAAETSVAAALAQIRIDSARLKRTESSLARAEEVLARHVVRAPFNGVVRRKLVEVGEWVETSTAAIELVDVDVLRLDVPVPQFYFSQIHEDTRVDIRLDALPDRLFEAAVTRKVPVSDAASRTFRVRIEIPNEAGLLAPGMSARVLFRVAGDGDQPVLVLPRDAVVRKPDGSVSVWVIEKRDGVSKAVPRSILVGRSHRDHVEVLEGDLSAGELVVVRGNEILRPGQSVLVAEEIRGDL